MPYLLLLKKQQNSKLSSAANYRWRFNLALDDTWSEAIIQETIDYLVTSSCDRKLDDHFQTSFISFLFQTSGFIYCISCHQTIMIYDINDGK